MRSTSWNTRGISSPVGCGPSCTTSPLSIPPNMCFGGWTSPTVWRMPSTSWSGSPTPSKASSSSTPNRLHSCARVAVAWRREPVAKPADGDDVLRVGRISFDPLPEAFHVGVQVSPAAGKVAAPDQLDDPLAGDCLVGVAQQDAQQLEFLAGYLDRLPADPHRMRPLVKEDVTDGENLGAERACRVGLADEGMDRSNKFWEAKRPPQDQHIMGRAIGELRSQGFVVASQQDHRCFGDGADLGVGVGGRQAALRAVQD